MDEQLKKLKKKAAQLPATPGVYLMKDSKGQVIYVGKAKALKNRVGSYFNLAHEDAKTLALLSNIADFEVILTDTEQECLLLECSLIKQHHPRYNILLKDDKGFHYLRVTPPPWSNFYAVKQLANDDAQYLGPYTSAYLVNQAVDGVKKIFRLPQCAKVFPRDIGKGRPCLNHFIKLCQAPCSGKVLQEDYAQCAADALSFLRQGESKAMQELEARMKQAAENLDFETAARLRDSLKAMKALKNKQKVMNTTHPEQDVFAIVRERGKSCLCVLRFKDSKLYDVENFLFPTPANLPAAWRELLLQYYTIRDFVPRRVVIDGTAQQGADHHENLEGIQDEKSCKAHNVYSEAVADLELLTNWMAEKAGHKVSVILPVKGEPLRLVEMCRANAAQHLAQNSGRTGKVTAALDELAAVLGLDTPPARIEAYDISHTGGENAVGGMVVFLDGVPLKRAYKRFQIRHAAAGDDCAAMAEVIERRLKRYIEERDENDDFGTLPDLVLLDGGQNQVNAVLSVVKSLGFTVPAFGMVKDSKHRTRAIAVDGKELSLTVKRQAFTLIGRIQEEVHRFAIAYHRQKRGKSSLAGTLTQIEGIGESRAKKLLKHFKTMKAIREATLDELTAVVGSKAAQSLFGEFKNKNE